MTADRRFAGGLRSPGQGRLQASVLLLAILALRFWNPAPIEALQVRLFDLYQWAHPLKVEESAVVIVDIDDRSLATVGQWPWPRNIMADIITRLSQSGAAVIALDIVFAEPDRVSPQSLVKLFESVAPNASAVLRDLPDTDRVLADAIANARVVLGQSVTTQKVEEGRPILRAPIAEIGGSPRSFLVSYPTLVRNIAAIEQAAQGRGVFLLNPEPDGITRRIPAVIRVGEQIYPTLAVEALRVATGQGAVAVKSDPAGVHSIVVAGAELMTDVRGRLSPRFGRRDPGRYVSVIDLLDGKISRDRIAGKIVLVGTSATGLLDIKTTPVDRALPGVEVHAMLIDGIMAGGLLTRPNYADLLELTMIFLLGGMAIAFVPMLGARRFLIAFVVAVAGSIGGAYYLFAEQSVLIDASMPAATAIILFGTLGYVNYSREETQRRAVRLAFSRYMAPALVERLARHPETLRLGGETRKITVLFADLRSFTTIAERLDAQALVTLMNRYFTPMTTAIQEHQGTIDKYIGDAIMAFWNAPLDDPAHARNACLAAIEMRRCLAGLNREMTAEQEATGQRAQALRFGIGICSGECAVGNIGSDQRFEYSALGDAVNLASRLEGQTKEYGVDNLVSETTAQAVDGLAMLEMDLIQVRGKTQPARIYTIVGDEALATDRNFQGLLPLHSQMLIEYRAGRWTAARHLAMKCAASADPFGLAGFYQDIIHRITELEASPPTNAWDGVYVAKTK